MIAGDSHTSIMVVRLKPDRMRSKITASYQLMAIIGSFDLIRQPLRAATSPYTPGGSALPVLRMKFVRIGARRRPYTQNRRTRHVI